MSLPSVEIFDDMLVQKAAGRVVCVDCNVNGLLIRASVM